MLKELWENVQKQKPLIHCITNYVTVNDVANVVLACGGSPIMADDVQEAVEITSICGGLYINIGTLNERTISSMLLAGKAASRMGHPIVLDPVGAGASALRTETANKLLQEMRVKVIRGNSSEIKTLAMGVGKTKGVDADAADRITAETMDEMVGLAKNLAEKTGAIVVITGITDIIANSGQAYLVHNGHSRMSQITGSGCMLTALLTACVTANQEQPMEAALTAVCAMGLCGQQAADKTGEQGGNATFRNHLIDCLSVLTGEQLEGGAHYELY